MLLICLNWFVILNWNHHSICWSMRRQNNLKIVQYSLLYILSNQFSLHLFIIIHLNCSFPLLPFEVGIKYVCIWNCINENQIKKILFIHLCFENNKNLIVFNYLFSLFQNQRLFCLLNLKKGYTFQMEWWRHIFSKYLNQI